MKNSVEVKKMTKPSVKNKPSLKKKASVKFKPSVKSTPPFAKKVEKKNKELQKGRKAVRTAKKKVKKDMQAKSGLKAEKWSVLKKQMKITMEVVKNSSYYGSLFNTGRYMRFKNRGLKMCQSSRPR